MNPAATIMKPLLVALGSLLLLSSCVFESPFEAVAKIPVDPSLLGRWESVRGKGTEPSERMLVMEHSPNEYVVEYPMGEKAMYFRAFDVELSGGKYMQIQWIGTAEGSLERRHRKFHLLKVSLSGNEMEMRTINPDVLGKDLGDSARMRAAFEKHKDDPKLFGEPEKFRRIE